MTHKIYFDPATGGFFDSRITPDVPESAKPITHERHADLLAAQAQGASIIASAKGTPRAIFPAARQRRTDLRAAIKGEARRRCLAVSPLWRQFNDLRLPSEAGARRFARIDAIRAASALIEQDLAESDAAALDAFPINSHPLWPED